jgi:hypothetical protein
MNTLPHGKGFVKEFLRKICIIISYNQKNFLRKIHRYVILNLTGNKKETSLWIPEK